MDIDGSQQQQQQNAIVRDLTVPFSVIEMMRIHFISLTEGTAGSPKL